MRRVRQLARAASSSVLALALCACAGISERRAPYEPSQQKFADLSQAAARFDERRTLAESSSTHIVSYLDSGVTLSNTACELWFTGLARAERDTALTKDLMNVVGNFILGITGINGANPATLGKGALGLSAANTAFEVYRADILLGSIEDIRAKIREDRKVAEDALLARTDISFDAARRRLLEYHQLCSVERIKVLLNTSLAGVKFERPDLTLSSPIDKATATVLTANLKSKLGDVDVLLQDQDLLYQVYLVLVPYRTADQSDPVVVINARKNQVVAIYAAKFATLSATDQAIVVTQLQQIAIALKFGDRLKSDTAAEAKQKLADAENALRNADGALNARLGALRGTQAGAQLLNRADASRTQEEFAAEVRKINSEDQLLFKAATRDPMLASSIKNYLAAQRQVSLAQAGASSVKAEVSTLPRITPKIVPAAQ